MELIEKPSMEKPADEAPEIHRHFVRYSRGKFSGPVLKITITAKIISLFGSFEYEKSLTEIFLRTLPSGAYQVTGTIIAPEDLNEDLRALGLPLHLEPPGKKTKTKNYKCQLKTATEMDRDDITALVSEFGKKAYVFLTIRGPQGSGISLVTKKNPPRPNQKNPDENSPDKQVQFCKVKVKNAPSTWEDIVTEVLRDFRDDLPKKVKRLILTNEYRINELELPEDRRNSRVVRVKTVRIGKLIRRVEVDGTSLEKQYDVRA
ncbi:MAG: hypothetical protein ACTSU5_18140 [Promethearchaeota archaeon]